jgi:hypothetical protein
MNKNYKVIYPNFSIRSKNELYKHLSTKNFSKEEIKLLVSDVLLNHNKYWRDNLKESKPEKNKWVRHAYNKKLYGLLNLINLKILMQGDVFCPDFIYGSVKKKSTKQAILNLLGKKNKRDIIKVDLKTFFEQITEDMVIKFFIKSII